MEFAEVVRRRRMVRNYDPDRPVPPEVVDRLLEHAIRAPSAGFSQGWGFLVLEEPADRDRFWAATTPTADGAATPWLAGMRRAPLIVVPHVQPVGLPRPVRRAGQGLDRPGRGPLAGAVLAHRHRVRALLMLLTAVDEGLGACFFGIPPERTAAFRAAFGVPEEFTPDRRAHGRLPGARPAVTVAAPRAAAGRRGGAPWPWWRWQRDR